MVSKRTITIQWIKLYALGKIDEVDLRRRAPSITDELMQNIRQKYQRNKE